MSNSDKRANMLVIIGAIVISVLLIGVVSYAYFTPIIKSGDIYTTSGRAKNNAPDITYSDENNTTGFTLTNAYPMTQAEGLATKPYEFSVTNNGTSTAKFDIFLDTKSDNTLDNKFVMVSIDGTTSALTSLTTTSSNLSGYSKSYALKTGQTIDAGVKKSYKVYGWITESATTDDPVQNKTWVSKIRIVASNA